MNSAGLPAEGEHFGAYILRDQLGRGGMGVVYRAEHVHLGRTVALKVLVPDLSGDSQFRDRFLRESRLAATLDHPNIVTVYDAGDVDGALYLAMRLVDGEDLFSLLQRRGALEPEEAVRRLDQVASALDAAHQAGLVHRDVKPQNVLVEGERSYLTDFGLTKPTTQGAMTAMTATGVFLGTPDYAAPEQISGEQVDARTDVYALTAVLYECLTGARPFARDSQVAVLYAHLHDPPPLPSAARPGLSAGLDMVVGCGMAKDPAERYDSCSELMVAARDALGAPTASAPTPSAATPAATQGGAPPPPTRHGGSAPTVESADERPTAARATAPATEAPTVPPPRPRPRRRLPLLAGLAALVLVAVIAVAVVALGGGDDGTAGPTVEGAPLKVGERPFGVAIGNGVLWVANNSSNSVSRLGTDGKSRTDINVGKQPFGLTQAGPAFWVANTGSDSVIRISIATGAAGKPIPVGDQPYFLTADPNTVFVANGGDGTITAIDARTAKVAGDPIRVGGVLRGIVSVNSAIWVVDNQSQTVKRVVNGRVTSTVPVGDNPVEIAFGSDALWVTNKADDTVSRIDLSGTAPKAKSIRVGKQPMGIAFGEGFAWVTNAKSNNVMRLDPKTGAVVGKPIPIPGQPVGIDARNGEVWVTSNDAGTVTRIDPG